MDVPPLSAQEWGLWHTWTEAHQAVADELEGALQTHVGISKAEFSILVTLHRADGRQARVRDIADALAWDKSRVAHLLTRMERRDLVQRSETGASGRRTSISLSTRGSASIEAALNVHAATIRHVFLGAMTPTQAAAFQAWGSQLRERSTARQRDLKRAR